MDTHPAIKKMLDPYAVEDQESAYHALREILQEITLLGLWRADFFKHAAFYGGSALRILYGLDRFSEDLDFTLLASNQDFDLGVYEQSLVKELETFGFNVEIEVKKKKTGDEIQSAFLKGNTIEHLMQINVPETILKSIHRDRKVKIKFEVDTNPPMDFSTEEKLLLQPIPFQVLTLQRESLFAGKMHALLCRKWANRPKGRDWYDLIWYVSSNIAVDIKHLEARLRQSCRYAGQDQEAIPEVVNETYVKSLLKKRINNLDIGSIKNDVRPFIKDPTVMNLWSKAFFDEVVDRIRFEN